MRMMLVMLVALLSFTTNTFAQAAPDPNFYIFLSFGQSNSEGFPGVEQQDKAVDKRFQMLAAVDFANMDRKKGNWYDAVPPLCRANTGVCPADYFGRTLVANLPPNIRVGVINVSVAGCKIELFQKDNYQTYATTAIMAGGTWRPILQSTQFAPFVPGDQHYLTSDNDARTWRVTLTSDAKLSTQLFADRGGNGVISDPAGNVYLASNEVYIYDKQGKQIGILEIPERPSSLILAGPDRQTLYIAARSSLYAIRLAR